MSSLGGISGAYRCRSHSLSYEEDNNSRDTQGPRQTQDKLWGYADISLPGGPAIMYSKMLMISR